MNTDSSNTRMRMKKMTWGHFTLLTIWTAECKCWLTVNCLLLVDVVSESWPVRQSRKPDRPLRVYGRPSGWTRSAWSRCPRYRWMGLYPPDPSPPGPYLDGSPDWERQTARDRDRVRQSVLRLKCITKRHTVTTERHTVTTDIRTAESLHIFRLYLH